MLMRTFCLSLQSSLFCCCSVIAAEQTLCFLIISTKCLLTPKNTSYPTTLKAKARTRCALYFAGEDKASQVRTGFKLYRAKNIFMH